jgi:hypothetical protein
MYKGAGAGAAHAEADQPQKIQRQNHLDARTIMFSTLQRAAADCNEKLRIMH